MLRFCYDPSQVRLENMLGNHENINHLYFVCFTNFTKVKLD